MNTVEPIRDKRDVYKMRDYLKEKNEKYYIMFMTGIYLGLRINEILKMTVGDVKGKTQATFRQSKTGKEVTVYYNAELLRAYKEYCKGKDLNEALVPTRSNIYKPISRNMAYTVLQDAAEHCKLPYKIGTHSLRKTCGYHYYRQTKDIATLQVWLNHSNPSDTLRYIGVTSDRVSQAMRHFKI